MRILELITEKTSHARDLNLISAHIANYIKTAWFPAAKEAVESGKRLTNGQFQHIEKAILSGKGVPAGKRDFSDYVFEIGGVSGMVPDGQYSEDLNMILPRLYVYMVPDVVGGRAHLPSEDDSDYHITLNSNEVIDKTGRVKTGSIVSLLMHELRHALDEYLSKGKAPFYRQPEDVSADDESFNDENSAYYKNQTEANARFSQVENRLINKLEMEKGNKEYTKEKYLEDVKKAFKKFHISKGDMKFTESEKQYRRFLKRAIDLYAEMKE